MSLQVLGDAVLVLALLVWIGFRQSTWRPVVVARMWRMPVVLVVVGAVELLQTAAPGGALTPLELLVLVVELAISLGVGAWMGAIAHFRPLATPVAVGRGDAVAEFESRTGPWGIVLWVLVIALRVGIDVVAGLAGLHLAASTGLILLMLAANRLARTLVFASRLGRVQSVAA